MNCFNLWTRYTAKLRNSSKTGKVVRLNKYSGIVCWFSGGRDSALACYFSKKVADIRGWDFRLVHINTKTPRPNDVDKYIWEYAKWLKAPLQIISPKKSFAELAVEYGLWPLLWHIRWCYFDLKYNVIVEFLKQDSRALEALHVFAVRRDESLFRSRHYGKVFDVKCYRPGLCVNVWLPLLYFDSQTVDRLIKRFNIPQSPVWYKIGSSGECMCLAGTSLKTLRLIAIHYPDVMEELAKIDDAIQTVRRKGPSYPAPLVGKKLTLRQWWEEFKRRPRIDYYLDNHNYEGKRCQGSCIL